MCGIVGLFCKSPELEPRLGEYLVGDARRRWTTAGPTAPASPSTATRRRAAGAS